MIKKILFFIIGLVIIGYFGYKYFELDKNQVFQNAIRGKDYKNAEVAVKDAIFNTVQKKAKEYFKEHNNYFISKTNNVCTSVQSLFDGVKVMSGNPIECSALDHTFTARLKSGLMNTYYCADSTGFYTTGLEETGYEEGVKCK